MPNCVFCKLNFPLEKLSECFVCENLICDNCEKECLIYNDKTQIDMCLYCIERRQNKQSLNKINNMPQ